MDPARDRRRYQRQQVLLPLRVTEKEPTGRILFQGDTVNVGAGGVYFRTLNWHEMQVGMPVHVIIDIPPEMFQLLPFGGLRGFGEIVRIERPLAEDGKGKPDGRAHHPCGVALRMTTRLRFDPDLHLPRFEAPKTKSNWPSDSARPQ